MQSTLDRVLEMGQHADDGDELYLAAQTGESRDLSMLLKAGLNRCTGR